MAELVKLTTFIPACGYVSQASLDFAADKIHLVRGSPDAAVRVADRFAHAGRRDSHVFRTCANAVVEAPTLSDSLAVRAAHAWALGRVGDSELWPALLQRWLPSTLPRASQPEAAGSATAAAVAQVLDAAAVVRHAGVPAAVAAAAPAVAESASAAPRDVGFAIAAAFASAAALAGCRLAADLPPSLLRLASEAAAAASAAGDAAEEDWVHRVPPGFAVAAAALAAASGAAPTAEVAAALTRRLGHKYPPTPWGTGGLVLPHRLGEPRVAARAAPPSARAWGVGATHWVGGVVLFPHAIGAEHVLDSGLVDGVVAARARLIRDALAAAPPPTGECPGVALVPRAALMSESAFVEALNAAGA